MSILDQKEIKPYTDIPYNTEEFERDPNNEFLNDMKEMQVGFGSKVMRADQQGLWLGASQFNDAPFSVDMEGNVIVNNLTATGGEITGVTITGGLIRTSVSGERIEIEDDALESFDTSGTRRTRIQNSGMAFYDDNGDLSASIFGGNSDQLAIQAGSMLYRVDDSGIYPYGVFGSVGSIGISTDHWLNGYIDNLYSDDIVADDSITLNGSTINDWTDIASDGATRQLDNLTGVAINTDLVSDNDGVDDLGDSSHYWDNLYVNDIRLDSGGNIYYNGVIAFDFSTGADEIYVGSSGLDNFVPHTNLGVNLGTSSLRFNDLHVAGADFYGNIDMNGNDIDDVDVLEFDTGEYITYAGSDMELHAGSDIEFYIGGVIKAIVDDNFFTEGDLLANGSKPFLIKHPDGSDRYLRYTAQESPEVILRHRGVGKTDSQNSCVIDLPKHFELVTDPKGLVTTNLTPIGDNHIYLKTKPTNAKIVVESSRPNTEFHYEVLAIRQGYLDSAVEIEEGDGTGLAEKMNSRSVKTANVQQRLQKRLRKVNKLQE